MSPLLKNNVWSECQRSVMLFICNIFSHINRRHEPSPWIKNLSSFYFVELRKGLKTSVLNVHSEWGQVAVGRSRSRSQDTLLLSVSIYHHVRVKEQAHFLDLSTSHSAQLFCWINANKGNLCTATPRVPKKKINTNERRQGGGRGAATEVNLFIWIAVTVIFCLIWSANGWFVLFWLSLGP